MDRCLLIAFLEVFILKWYVREVQAFLWWVWETFGQILKNGQYFMRFEFNHFSFTPSVLFTVDIQYTPTPLFVVAVCKNNRPIRPLIWYIGYRSDTAALTHNNKKASFVTKWQQLTDYLLPSFCFVFLIMGLNNKMTITNFSFHDLISPINFYYYILLLLLYIFLLWIQLKLERVRAFVCQPKTFYIIYYFHSVTYEADNCWGFHLLHHLHFPWNI